MSQDSSHRLNMVLYVDVLSPHEAERAGFKPGYTRIPNENDLDHFQYWTEEYEDVIISMT